MRGETAMERMSEFPRATACRPDVGRDAQFLRKRRQTFGVGGAFSLQALHQQHLM